MSPTRWWRILERCYRPRNVLADRVYGYSLLQQVLMTVNIARVTISTSGSPASSATRFAHDPEKYA